MFFANDVFCKSLELLTVQGGNEYPATCTQESPNSNMENPTYPLSPAAIHKSVSDSYTSFT